MRWNYGTFEITYRPFNGEPFRRSVGVGEISISGNDILFTDANATRLQAPYHASRVVEMVDKSTDEIIATPIEFLRNRLFAAYTAELGGVPLAVAIDALPLPRLGRATAHKLAQHYGTLGVFRSGLDHAFEEWTRSAKLREYLGDDDFIAVLQGEIPPDVGDMSEFEYAIDPARFPALYGLVGIPGVGKATLKRLVDSIRSIDWSLLTAWAVLPFKELIESDAPLRGKTVAFTGDLPDMSRSQAQAAAQAAGAKVVGLVSQTTDYVIVGQGASARKLAQAAKRGIKTIDCAEFLRLIDLSSDGNRLTGAGTG